MVSGFVTSVVDKVIAGKYVVRARVQRYSQRMNDHHLVNIWVISENDGTILSHAHISRVFYFEATTRIHGKLACTGKMLMDFANICMRGLRSSKKKRFQKTEDLQQLQASNQASSSGTASAGASAPQRMQRASPPSKEIKALF